MEAKFEERRKYVRIPAAIKISYVVKGEFPNESKEAVGTNISRNGILISVSEPIAISSILDLRLISSRTVNVIKAEGRVARVEEKDVNKYEIGILLTKISEDGVELINQWIRTVDLDKILTAAVEKNASDIHFVTDQPPIMRIYGDLAFIGTVKITQDQIQEVVSGILSERQKEQFKKDLELDVSYANDIGRFRVNLLQSNNQIAAVFRYVPAEVKGIDYWHLPEVVRDLAMRPNGLILVTGPQGNGKSTTLSAMIDVINTKKKRIIISLEEPIEYIYKSKKSIIIQREVGIDTHSFVSALKHIIRQDANVILVGEMRDLDSIAICIAAAESGHLVLTTLPTQDVISSINRIIDAFPPIQQQHVRMRLSETLKGIISQVLLPRKDQEGRVVATEILISTVAAANIIRKGNLEDLHSLIATGIKYGMHTMESSFERLLNDGVISHDTFMTYMADRDRGI